MKLIIFDLDGTLIDSAEDIARSVNEVRASYALEPLPLDRIASYVGNGVRTLLQRALPDADRDSIDRAHETYMPIYRRRLLDNTRLYPGVLPALDELDHPERTLAVLTNKPRRETMMILEGLGLDRRFSFVYGGDSFARKKPDPMGVERLLDDAEAPAADALFVGDSSVDLETARRAGVRCCLVTYGMGPPTSRYSKSTPLEPDVWLDDLRELPVVVGAMR